MKLGSVLPIFVLLGMAVGACGEARKVVRSSPALSSKAAVISGAPVSASSGATPMRGHLRGDEDDDDTNEISDPNIQFDSDNDKDNDYRNNQRAGYVDGDDGIIRNYGHPASTADEQAITALVKRYYAAAVADNAVTVCGLTYSTLAEAIPEDLGPTYQPHAHTCAAVLMAIFRKFHSRLAGPVFLTGVRVGHGHADVLLGSPGGPASMLEARREHGVWKIDRLLPGSLP